MSEKERSGVVSGGGGGCHTQLHTVESVEVAGKHHLAQAEAGAKGREEADGEDSEDVDEEDREEGIHEA